LENEFLITEISPGINETRNTPESIHQGLEAGLTWEFLPQDTVDPDSLQLSQTYTWNHFRLQDDPKFGDNPIPGIPEHLLQTSLSYQQSSGFFTSASLQFQPVGIYADYAHTLKSDSFASLDWKIGYTRSSGIQVFFEIRNLTDEQYITEVTVVSRPSGTERYFFPSSGRAVYGGIAWKW
jgi:iron complex outermembrane receptor protein